MLLEVEYGHFPAGENIADTHRHAKGNHSPATSHRHHIFRLPPQQDRHLTPPSFEAQDIQNDQAAPKDQTRTLVQAQLPEFEFPSPFST